MHLARCALGALLLAVLAACGGGGGDDSDRETALRIINVAPDAPPVSVLLDDRIIAGSLEYGQSARFGSRGTSFLLLTPRAYDVEVQVEVPAGDETIVSLPDQSLVSDTEYTVLALGLLGSDDVSGLVLQNPIEAIPAGNVRLQFVHGAPGALPADIYVTTPGAPLDQATPFATLAYRESSPRLAQPAGDYQIRITVAGDPAALLFDSGTASFTNDRDLLAVVVPNTGTGDATLSLIINDGVITAPLSDRNAVAEVRVLNLSPDGPDVRVTADPADTSPVVDLTSAFPAGLPFTESTGYRELTPQEHEFTVVDAANPSTAIVKRIQILGQNVRITLAVVGKLGSIGSVVLDDNARAVATEGRIRVLNAAPSRNPVDIYLLRTDQAIADALPVFPSLGLGSATAYLSVAPRDYTLTVTTPGTKTVLATATIPAPVSSVQTAIVLDADGGGAPLSVQVENDLGP